MRGSRSSAGLIRLLYISKLLPLSGSHQLPWKSRHYATNNIIIPFVHMPSTNVGVSYSARLFYNATRLRPFPLHPDKRRNSAYLLSLTINNQSLFFLEISGNSATKQSCYTSSSQSYLACHKHRHLRVLCS